ncbi:hypothetical protein J7E96_08310 [Streptomyces sp. ISL-96]|uniref:hypothetical protein n=1 Tax=unclassified Streptomyces TaxID=2593676 RepID=UPI001BE5A254|nr:MULTISPECIES: hypothetical protein [unclassified Streptomyces]MBT2400620.1 hypothetical protein [Streptomyces sp. ISL-100]MBT2488524.1 hypothetical protein [Streptomyces sp. ISL-96]
MYRSPPPVGSVRPLTEANEAIRALVESRADEAWPADEYEVLLLRWAAAVRGEVAEAA